MTKAKDHAALYAAVRDLKKQVSKIDVTALARLAKKVAANKAAIEKINTKSKTKAKDAETAETLWKDAVSHHLAELVAATFRIEMRTAHPDARPTPEHPDAKPTPRER